MNNSLLSGFLHLLYWPSRPKKGNLFSKSASLDQLADWFRDWGIGSMALYTTTNKETELLYSMCIQLLLKIYGASSYSLLRFCAKKLMRTVVESNMFIDRISRIYWHKMDLLSTFSSWISLPLDALILHNISTRII